MTSRAQGNQRRLSMTISVLLLVFGLLITLIGVALFVEPVHEDQELFVGVDLGYGDENEVYHVADATHGFANLIIIGSTKVTSNTSKLITVCEYLYQRGFYFIVYVGFAGTVLPPRGPNATFFDYAGRHWGNRFLGAYLFDEVGGKQMDYEIDNPDKSVARADNTSDAAIHFMINLNTFLFLEKQVFYSPPSDLKLFTSDYALYWYDFLSGYDTVFCEFVGEPIGNENRQVAIALDRGAAKTLGKNWGTIITYGHADGGLENGTQLYSDMRLAWQSGARYIVVFDGNSTPSGQSGVLKQEHLDAMKKFWDEAKGGNRYNEFQADVAYVLPTDYGYGFRGPEDKIWGLWNADSLTTNATKIWEDTEHLLTKYEGKIDIIYEEKTRNAPVDLPYRTLIYWNGTTIQR
jgi:hypothetical protein